MHKQGANVSDVYSARDGTGTVVGSFLAKLDDLLAIEVGQVQFPEPCAKQVETETL
jgi:hypothetical protein